MKQHKSTIKRLIEFAEYHFIEIMCMLCLLVLLATVAILPIGLNTICWVVCAPFALILVYVIARGILDLINEYRWYFGLDKDNKKKQTP